MRKINNKIYTVPFIALTYGCNFSCKNCYVRGLEKNFPKHLSLDDFRELIGWIVKQNIKRVVFTGGEPTSHPDFSTIIDLLAKESLGVDLVSNCLFPEKILRKINKNVVKYLVVDYITPERAYFDYKKYIFNIEKIHSKGIPIHFFCRVPLDQKNQQDLLLKLQKYNASTSLRLVMPGFSGEKISFAKRKKQMREIIPFLKFLEKNNTDFSLYDPLLRCAFSKEEWVLLEKRFHLRTICSSLKYPSSWRDRQSYLDRLTVAPDLSIFPCYALFFKGPKITSFNNLDEINSLFKVFYEKWRWTIPVNKECLSCEHYKKRECQGGCLNHKYYQKYKGKIIDI